MPVSEAKIAVRDDMINNNEATLMYEFSARPVTCRCNTPVVIKIVEDQWFLNYADEDWKKKARSCLKHMDLVPRETRAQFEHTIEWLHEWPCTRKIGMGTPAPWDPNWVIESLSDSTIYMAYYTISHILKTVEPGKLSDEVFDHIFYGKGRTEDISASSGIEAEKLKRMRREFEYWYPLDYRMSANELIPNHLTFHIFHHAQLFPDRSPRGIVSFGMAILEGEKMSSSKGNIIAINEAVRRYGADTVRVYLMSVSEPWQDLDWKAVEVAAMQRNLERFYSLADEIISLPSQGAPILGQPERWILSMLQKRIKEVTGALESFETRKGIQCAFFMPMQDIRRYMRRAKNLDARAYTLKRVLDVWLRLVAPFAPHVCEELWKQFGKEGFISVAPWPTVDTGAIDETAEFTEDFIARVIQDIGEIMKVLKTKPERAYLYVAQDWKWKAYRMTLKHVRIGEIDFGKLLHKVEHEFKPELCKADLSKLLQQMVRAARETSEEELKLIEGVTIDELAILKEASDFIREQLGLRKVLIFKADDPARHDPNDRARMSFPLRPAIYLE
jgi:leucyl-tRNA synthetase